MFFKMPTVVYEGEDCVLSNSAQLAALGTKALIVTGRQSAKANGSESDVCAALEKEGRGWVIFDQVEENPSVETVMKAREFGVREQVDFVIGIGGGSPLDAAKAAALMIAHPDRDWDYMYERTAKEKALPIAAVPTTCGTGAEVTGVSVLTRHDLRTKGSIAHKLFPQLALVDAKYIENTPLSVIQSTAIDALAHLVESGINTAATDYSHMFVQYGLTTWSLTKSVLLGIKKPDGEDLRNLMNASTYAGMAIAHTGTGIPHALSYDLTYELGMAHGKACGYFLPGYLRETPGHERRDILEMADFCDVGEFTGFVRSVCDFGEVPKELLERDMQKVADNAAKRATCPYPLDEDVFRRICGI